MDDELIRHMQNWARQYPGMSMEDLAKLYFNQNKHLYPGKPPSHEDLRSWYLGERAAAKRGTNTPAYDSLPQKYPAWPEKRPSPSKSPMDMLADQLGKGAPSVEFGTVGPSIDPRIARKFVM